jgi:hypothetical protein
MDPEEMAAAQRALVQRWGIARLPETPEDDDLARRLLLDAVEERIIVMFQRDYDRMRTTLYRLDVAEAEFKAALGQPDLRGKARALAEIILDREMRKAETWVRYAREQRRANAARELSGEPHKELPDAPE